MRKLLLVATCLVVMAPALAYAAGVDDPDDTAGRLDIKYTGSHIEGTRHVFEVEMFQNWPDHLFRKNGRRGYLHAFFNTRGDGRWEWKVEIDRTNKGWRGLLCERQRGGLQACQRAPVWRSEATSIEFSIRPDRILKDGDTSYAWRAKTRLRFAKGCAGTGRKYCIDRTLGKQAD